MASWRPVRGEIIRFDHTLASVESIEKFFADNRIIARGIDAGDTYEVELAVTGRRRRVATLDQAGEVVVPGPSVPDLVELMDKTLRKVQIDIAGEVAWGNIDLGEVDVSWDLSTPSPEPESADTPPTALPAETELAPGADEEGVEGAFPDLPEGPMLLLSDPFLRRTPQIRRSSGHSNCGVRIWRDQGGARRFAHPGPRSAGFAQVRHLAVHRSQWLRIPGAGNSSGQSAVRLGVGLFLHRYAVG